MQVPLRCAAIAPGLVVLAIAAGCGGGDDDARLTKAEFVAKGDEICKQAREEFVKEQPGPPVTPDQAVALQQNLIQISDDELARIRGLDAPSELEPALGRYLKAREEGVALLKQGLEAAQDKDLRAYAAAQSKVAAGQVRRLKLAQTVGFDQCSRPVPQGSSAQ
jgi:hypothetical protein